MTTTLERSMPSYDFCERHSRWIAADPQRVWQALTTVTIGELTITRRLVAIRHLGGASLKRHRSLFSEGPVRMLEVSAPWYAVGGNIARPWQRTPQTRPFGSLEEFVAFSEPGWVKYLTDFHVQTSGAGIQLTTVTRGCSTDRAARLRFAPYWAVIRPASGLIRRELLAAVARTARLDPHRTASS